MDFGNSTFFSVFEATDNLNPHGMSNCFKHVSRLFNTFRIKIFKLHSSLSFAANIVKYVDVMQDNQLTIINGARQKNKQTSF